jgi:hypothetical protein
LRAAGVADFVGQSCLGRRDAWLDRDKFLTRVFFTCQVRVSVSRFQQRCTSLLHFLTSSTYSLLASSLRPCASLVCQLVVGCQRTWIWNVMARSAAVWARMDPSRDQKVECRFDLS